jgi:excisionase family DNA binding protein
MVNSHVESAEQFLSVNEVATVIGVHPVTIRRWIGSGQLTSIRVGGRIRIPDSVVQGLLRKGVVRRKDTNALEGLSQRVSRIENSLNMLLDELGYGSVGHTYSKNELNALATKAAQLLTKKSGWTFREADHWAEIVLRLNDTDVIRLTSSQEDQWVPIYTLLSRMRSKTSTATEADEVLQVKLNKALGHLRSLVYACRRMVDPKSKLQTHLAKVSKLIGAEPLPTTQRVCRWFETKYQVSA